MEGILQFNSSLLFLIACPTPLGNNKGGVQALVLNKASELLSDKAIIPFDTVVSNIGNIISLDNTGVFTVTTSGMFIVDYYVNINGTDSTVDVKLTCNGISSEATYAVLGLMSGLALLYLTKGDKISIINDSSLSILLGPNSILAGVIIYKV